MPAQLVLALVMALGLALSVAASRMVDAVEAGSAMLLRQDIPKLEQFTAFESELLLHQAALDNDFAYPAEHEHFHAVADETRQAMQRHYAQVVKQITGTDDQDVLQREFGRLQTMDDTLRRSLDQTRGDPATRRLLAQFNASTDAIRRIINGSRKDLQSALSRSGRMALERTRWIADMVHLYIGFTLLSALCLAHQVRARVRSEAKLAHLAAHDQMTRLPHRSTFYQRIERLIASLQREDRRERRRETASALPWRPHLLLVEADRFDRMVAGIGHAGADHLIRQMAARAEEVARAGGAEAFRLGDSKFALLLSPTSDRVAERVTARLQARLAEPIAVGDDEIVLSTSIGSATLSKPGQDALALVQEAEMALHLARRSGGAHVAYCQALDHQVRANVALEAQLRHAIERGELELHYQPQQRLSDGALIGFEALLRWRTRTDMVPPARFIPIAEESGLILSIGDWVLEQACRQAKEWNANAYAPLTIAVNISPRQFGQPRFLERVRQHLADSGVRPSQIELEITEGILMEHAALSSDLLTELKALGLKLAIDDFGAGYSSLSYLKRFPVHKLKIDQAFVRQLKERGDDAEIVKAVISLGHNLGFSVIAEGVEASGQAAMLAAWGCDEIQGYFYGKPMPAEVAANFIRQVGEPLPIEA